LLNGTSLIGCVLATLGLGSSTFLLLLDVFDVPQRPYTGILTFLIFPCVLFLDLLLVPLGALRHRRRLRRPGASLPPCHDTARSKLHAIPGHAD